MRLTPTAICGTMQADETFLSRDPKGLTMRISIHAAQRRFTLDAAALKRLIAELASRAQAQQPDEPPWREVTVHLLDDASIAPVNAAIMGHEGATDVITQRYEPCPGEPEGLIGELFVNVERAVCAGRSLPSVPRRGRGNAAGYLRRQTAGPRWR